jgi:hypothetical protein
VRSALAAHHRHTHPKQLGEKEAMKKLGLFVSLAVLLTIMVGCSALDKLNKNKNGGGTPFNLTGSWEVVATSTANPGVVGYVEFNAAQDSSGNISAPTQEFSLTNSSASTFGNCLGAAPGNQGNGNVTATVGVDNIQGNYTETGPGGSATFDINTSLTSATTFSGNYAPIDPNGTMPSSCSDVGTYVATKTAPFSGHYSGMLTYPDGTQEMMNLTATQDSAYNLTVTGTATGGSKNGPIALGGTVTGNLAQLHSSTTVGPVFSGFAWWGAVHQKLNIVDDSGYVYGSLSRQ